MVYFADSNKISFNNEIEKLLSSSTSVLSFGSFKPTTNQINPDGLANYILSNFDFNNKSSIVYYHNRVKAKIRELNIKKQLDFSNSITNQEIESLETLIILDENFDKYLKQQVKTEGLPYTENDLKGKEDGYFEKIEKIGLKDFLKKKYTKQYLNIICVLGGDIKKFNIPTIKKQTEYYCFCHITGVIEFLEKHYQYETKKNISEKIGYFLKEISVYNETNGFKDSALNFKRNYQSSKGGNSKYYALKEKNIEFADGILQNMLKASS